MISPQSIRKGITIKFDGIFMDTHCDENYNEFEKYCKLIANENLTDFEYTTQIETQLEKSNWVNLKEFSELNLF